MPEEHCKLDINEIYALKDKNRQLYFAFIIIKTCNYNVSHVFHILNGKRDNHSHSIHPTIHAHRTPIL